MAIMPEQHLRIAEMLLKSTVELKLFFAEMNAEKKDKNVYPLQSMEEIFDSTSHQLKEQGTHEKEFKFPDASGIRVSTVWDIDIPPPAANAITIFELPKNKAVATLNRENPKYNDLIKGNHIKIQAKIESNAKGKALSYDGYKIRIIPKVRYNN